MGRWDHLYDLQPQKVDDFLLDRLAEELERDLRDFPPLVADWQSEEDRRRYEPLLRSGRKPSEAVVRTALWLAQADLRREFEAVDQFMRNGGIEQRLESPEDRDLCRFLWNYLEDSCLSFAEATRSRFRRPELAEALARLEKRLYPDRLLS